MVVVVAFIPPSTFPSIAELSMIIFLFIVLCTLFFVMAFLGFHLENVIVETALKIARR